MAEYPIKIKVASYLIDEFANCEQGRYEDHTHEPECPACDGACATEPFAYDILQRWRTMIEVRNQAEAEEIYWAVSSGTFQLAEDGHLQAAQRIADTLLKAGAIETPEIRRWYPSGY